MTQIRKPTDAGMFYNSQAHQLRDQIQDCFLSKDGPGKKVDYQEKESPIISAIVPHAGYTFSGCIAAHSYQAIASSGLADVFIILGPNHRGYGSGVAMSSKGVWETPLGEIPVDEKRQIMAALKNARGNRTRAARLLGMSRATFYRRLTALDINTKK